MAQRRMIDKRISVSEQVANLPVEAQLIFTWMIPHADDVGLLPHSVRTLKALVVPMMDITVETFGNHLEAMRKEGLIEVFEWAGETFWKIVKFLDTQTLKKDRKPQTIGKGIEDWNTVDSIWKTAGSTMEDTGNLSKGKQSEVNRSEEKRSKENTGELPRPVIIKTKNDVAAVLKARYNFSPPTDQKNISTQWQEKAFRYAEKLQIQLTEQMKPRWLKVFKLADQGRKKGNIDKAYSYLVDYDGNLSDEEKIRYFFHIYENGL